MLKTIQYIDSAKSVTSGILKPFIIDITRDYNLKFDSRLVSDRQYPDVPEINFLDEFDNVIRTSGFRLPGYFIEQIETMLDEDKRTLEFNKLEHGTGETTAQSAQARETQSEAQEGSETYESNETGAKEDEDARLSI